MTTSYYTAQNAGEAACMAQWLGARTPKPALALTSSVTWATAADSASSSVKWG